MADGLRACGAALAFLTRIPVPEGCHSIALSRTLVFFPGAGFVLGVLATLPVLSGWCADAPVVLGAVYAALLAWLTRGLHWDGLADICDACGSNARGIRFYEILKDSRIGAFGAMGLVFGAVVMASLAAACVSSPRGVFMLICAPAIARCLPSVLLYHAPVREGSGLAQALCGGSGKKVFFIHFVLAMILSVWGLGIVRACVLAVLCALIIGWLVRLARREQGMNGDFAGTAIILGEMASLAAAL